MFEELKPHLVELQKRLIISAISIIVCFFVAFAFWEPIVDFMAKPLVSIMNVGSEQITLIDTNGEEKVLTGTQTSKFITTGVLEGFLTVLKVSFFIGLTFSLPIVFWQIWLFIAPGLYDNEKKYVVPFVLFATIMFICGASFCYYVVLPLALHFLVFFGGDTFSLMPRISEYISFLVKIMFGFGTSFELPVIAFFLGKLGLITDQTLKGYFRYAIVIIFIVAAILTPPDVTSQILMAIPLIALYGLSILILKVVNPYVPENDNEEEKEENEATS